MTLLIVVSFFIALSCAIYASLMSWKLIYYHLQNMTCPHIQSKMIGIIWMIPIYSVDCVLSLLFPGAAVAIGMMRDCYEAYALYLFLAMLLAFLSNDDEAQLVDYLESLPPHSYPSPFHYCCQDTLDGKQYLRFVKFGTLQYCLVRPLMALVALASFWFGMYEEGNFDPLKSSYLFIVIVSNFSVMLAFSSLLSCFHKFKYDLRPFNPLPKFLCVKSIIFCIFWQGILIALLLEFEVISPPHDSSYHKASFAVAMQDFLICIEMAIASMVNMYAFDYKPYSGENIEEIFLQRKRSESLTESLLLPKDDDANDGVKSRRESMKTLPRGYRRSSAPKYANKSNKEKSKNKGEASIARHSDSDTADTFINVNSKNDLGHEQRDDGGRHGRDRSNSTAKLLGTPLLGLVSNADIQRKRHAELAKKLDGGSSRSLTTSDSFYERGGGLEIDFDQDVNKKSSSCRKKEKGSGLKGIVNKNFAHSTAVRDFNETMPILLPSDFKPKSGTLIHSNPNDRVRGEDSV